MEEKHQIDSYDRLKEAVLGITAASNYRPLKPRQIAKRLNLSKQGAADLKRVVKRMVREGLLVYGSNHMLEAAASKEETPGETQTKATGKASTPAKKLKGNRLVGVFQRSDRGFGFVRPRVIGPTSEEAQKGAKKADRSEIVDIYIPAKHSGDASSGDLVVVRLMRPDKRDHRRAGKDVGVKLGPRGEIVEILQRQTHRFVGTYQESAGSAFVQVDGSIFAAPIYVGDPGAKGVRVDDKVVFEMIRFPSSFREGEGAIIEVLGPRGKPGVDTLSIIREFELPDEFAADALLEAHRAASLPLDKVPEDRLDLSGETIITIDPADARDFDDAISLEKFDDGRWRLGVHIADVSHYVRPNSALDREAVHRSTSVYLPDRVIPMLPEVISNGVASLQPGKMRFAKTVFIEYTPDGLRTAVEHHCSAIKSCKRLTYEQVDEFLADPKSWRRKLGAKVHDLLGRMHELSRILRKRRFAAGALELSLSEVEIELGGNGEVVGAHETVNTESHRIIEEFMLAANEAVAETLRDKELFFLRRIHEPPTPRKLKALTEYVQELGVKTESLESRFALQKVLKAAGCRDDGQVITFAVLRSLQQAVYSPQEEGHYALASDCYCHFTSPIRRYPDLTIHRLLDAIIKKQPPRNDFNELVALGELCSNRERRAETAERELVKLKLLNYMSKRIGQVFDVVVTGVERFGLFVRGIDLPAEGLIRIELLADDNYYFDRASHSLSGHRTGNTFRLGDRLRAEVAHVDLERRELDFRPAAKTAAGRRGSAAGAKRAKKKRQRR